VQKSRKDRVVRLGSSQHPAPAVGLALGIALCVVATAALVPFRTGVTVATPALVLVLPVVFTAIVGGRVASLCIAVIAAGAFNLAFIPPYWRPTIAVVDDAVALGVFLSVALAVGTLVAEGAERRRAAEQRAEEAQPLSDRYDAVSHDLRTPLATIRAVTSDLRAGAAYDDATRDDLLDLVGDEAERLDRIVANLLSLSRIEAGALQPDRQAVALEELVTERVRRLSPLFRQVRVQVDMPADLSLVDADYSQLDQVVTNLLENAARHSPPRSTVRVGARQRDTMVEVWVDDQGVGVARFNRSRIFEPFRRGTGSASSGVGLAICKAIVEAHGGAIEVEASAEGGARFCFTLPVRHE